MTARTEHPLAFALGMFAGAIVADLLLIGGEAFAHLMHWRGQR